MILTQVYEINNFIIVIGGHAVHSYGRLVHYNQVITKGDQLLPPGNGTEPGRMDCKRTATETPHFVFFGGDPPSNLVNQSVEDGDRMATLFFKRSYLSMNTSKNVEGSCEGGNRNTYFYIYLLPGNTYVLVIPGITYNMQTFNHMHCNYSIK